jgi:hypothetical protein
MDAGTFDQELNRHLSWDGVALDRRAWNQLGSRLDALLSRLPQLEVASASRLKATKGEEIPTIIGLTAFQSPQPVEVMLKAPRRQVAVNDIGPTTSFAITPQMAKALSNRWRCRILMELTARPMSPSLFVEEIGGSMTNIARCFRQLKKWGYVEVIEEKRGGRHGGGIERIYRNTQRAFFDMKAWETLPLLVRNEVSWSFLSSYFDRITEALEEDTFDTQEDRHLSWTPILFDRNAWNEISNLLDEILEWLPHLEEESVRRAGSHVDQLIPTIVGLTSFRSPKYEARP